MASTVNPLPSLFIPIELQATQLLAFKTRIAAIRKVLLSGDTTFFVSSYTEPPYWYYPIRQSLGASQLMAGNLAGAEETFRASLVRAPNNGWALFGLTQVFKRRGDEADAKAAQQLLDDAWVGDLRTLNLASL